MVFDQLRAEIATRLDESDRGDRGWFIITRVHVSTDWVKGISEYLYSKAGLDEFNLTALDYRRIARIVRIGSTNPGIQLRRHHLLVMEKPLQLIQRLSPHSWQHGIKLTQRGFELASTNDPASVLEKVLGDIIFSKEPWSPPDRVDQYSEFSVNAYLAAIEVVKNCGGYIDRDEFDLFLSRVRNEEEIHETIDRIHRYRDLSENQQILLLQEVSNRMPSDKTYGNWRDMGLHTFSLFGLGTSLVRHGQKLYTTGTWTDAEILTVESVEPVEPVEPVLKLPEPPGGELNSPPAAPASNDGTDGESFVAKVYSSKGWQVSFYTNRKGFGFDLWAHRGDSAVVIEVKSSIGRMGIVSLTNTEYLAARQYGDNYVLAIVEHIVTEKPKLTLIQNPAGQLAFQAKDTTIYCVSREVWQGLQ